MFEPSELEMAISPLPLRITIILDTTSGMLVPAASIVKPAMVSGISNVYDMITIIQTSKYVSRPKYTVDMINVTK